MWETTFLESIAHLVRHERCREHVGIFPGKGSQGASILASENKQRQLGIVEIGERLLFMAW